MTEIAILGGGTWGTALASIAGRAGANVHIWTRDEMIAASINSTRHNPRLAGYEIPSNVTATTDLEFAVASADLVVAASPSHVLGDLFEKLQTFLPEESVLVSAAKGIENSSLLRISEIAFDVIGNSIKSRFVVLSGPSFAREAADGQPTAVTAASQGAESALRVQQAFSVGNFRVYTNDDVIGTELGGSVKNVIAIAAGMVTGLGLGHNSVAALITRGLAEMGRMNVKLGGRHETMMGLAGLGDLVLTCNGDQSRNRQVGVELGRGRRLADITADMTEVAEGIRTTAAVHQLALRQRIEMPITAEVFSVLYEQKPVADAPDALMRRPLRAEF